jgi:hypothetical protein
VARVGQGALELMEQNAWDATDQGRATMLRVSCQNAGSESSCSKKMTVGTASLLIRYGGVRATNCKT